MDFTAAFVFTIGGVETS